MHFGWVRFNIEISKVTGPNFTGLVSPNAGGIAIDGMTIWFWISSSVSEIFATELRSHPKSGQISHVFRPRNFFGVCPSKFWTGIIKFGLVLTIVQNFKPVGPRISEIWRSEKKSSGLKHKSFRKLSFSGGLKTWPDWDKIWHSWLRRPSDPSRKISCKSAKGVSRQIGEIYAKIFIAIYLFFFHALTGQTSQRIFSRSGSNDAVSGKGVLFWG